MKVTKEPKREHRINLRVADSVFKRMEELSHRMGMASATLASVAISEYLDAKLRQQEQMRMVADAMAKTFQGVLDDPEAMAAILSASEAYDGDQNRLQGM